jgi:hypothetical protein
MTSKYFTGLAISCRLARFPVHRGRDRASCSKKPQTEPSVDARDDRNCQNLSRLATQYSVANNMRGINPRPKRIFHQSLISWRVGARPEALRLALEPKGGQASCPLLRSQGLLQHDPNARRFSYGGLRAGINSPIVDRQLWSVSPID